MSKIDWLRRHYANVTATVALVVALTAGGAWALKANTVGPKQLKRGAVKAKHLGKKSVKPRAITPGAVGAREVADDGIEPQNLDLPEPGLLTFGDQVTFNGVTEFEKVATIGTYEKMDADSVLQVDWSGSAKAIGVGCALELRLDGETDARGTGRAFVSHGDQPTSLGASALFSGLGVGPHTVEIWARQIAQSPMASCVLSPAETEIGQTVVVTEVVV